MKRHELDAQQDAQRAAHPEQAGWGYPSQGACYDPITHHDYPWHDEYTGPRIDLQSKCLRCGARRPV